MNQRPQPPTEDDVDKAFERLQDERAEYDRADRARKAERATLSLEERVKRLEVWMDGLLNVSVPPAQTRAQVKECMNKKYEQDHLEWEEECNQGVFYRGAAYR